MGQPRLEGSLSVSTKYWVLQRSVFSISLQHGLEEQVTDNLGTGSHRPDDLRQNASQQGQADGQRGSRLFADEELGAGEGGQPTPECTQLG